MHEVAIAQSIIDIAEKEARKYGAPSIRKIKLIVGEFRGVVKDALEFSFAALRKNTLAAEAELEVETVSLRVECGNCGPVNCSLSDFNLLCPQCGNFLTITAGREMRVEYIDLE
ncbi:MAG: hydrogenase maturation nickel metallochaperone HypA [Acidobacteria bacterium]|nr:hydrogenase maturation nickel metallochaperone HypA [Acidobacteriota bacterium]